MSQKQERQPAHDTPSPLPDGLVAWKAYLVGLDAEAERNQIPKNSVETHRLRMLEAMDMLGYVASRSGLKEVATNPELEDVREERASHYEEGAFEKEVIPGAMNNRRFALGESEKLIDEVIGDLEKAKKFAWGDFTPAERAELELHPEHGMERDEIHSNFIARYGKGESQNRKRAKRKMKKAA